MNKVKIGEDGLARASNFTLHNSLDEGTYQDYTVYSERGHDYMENLINYYNDELNSTPILKVNSGKTQRDKHGNIIYRGEKFPAYNKPIRDSGKKQGKVLVKEGKRIGIVRFGDPSLRDNYSNEANDNFYARFGNQKGLNDKFSPLYWSAKWLWPRGDSKGKGAKPFATLKKADDEVMVEQEVKQSSSLLQAFQILLPFLKDNQQQPLLNEIRKEDDEEEDDDYEEEVEEQENDDDRDTEDSENSDDDDEEDDLEDIEKEDSVNIVKQFDEEAMIAIEPLYINVGDSDAHGDGITDEDLDKLIDNFNTNIANIKGNIHHAAMTDGFYPVKAYRLPMDVYIGDPNDKESMTKICEGQPIVKVQFRDTDIGRKLWEKRKSGTLRGVSIGARGRRVENPDYQGDD